MYQKIIKATILIILFLPAYLPAAMDFIFDETLTQSLSQMEQLYLDKQWDKAMHVGRGIIKDAPKNHPAAGRARDLIILSLDGKNKELIAQQNKKKLKNNRTNAKKLLAEGSKMLADKKYRVAAEKFSRALKLHPGDAQCYFLLGYAQLKSGKSNDAYRSLYKCLKLDNKHTRALFHIAGLSFSLKKNKEALQYSSLLIKQLLERISELREILLAQKEQQLNDKAIETARKIKSLKHNLGQASYMHGVLSARKGDHKTAIKSLNRAAKIQPTSADIWQELGKSMLKEKVYHQATVALEQAIFIRETRLRELRTKAGKLLDAGKSDAAVEAELETKRLKEQIADALYTLAIANGKKKETITALENIEQAIELKPDFIEARYAKAVLLAEKNNLDEAIEEMRQVLQKSPPKSEQAKRAIKTITHFMDLIAKRDNPQIANITKEKQGTVEVHEYVKNMPGVGGKAQEAEWEEIFMQLREIKKLFTMRNIPEAIRRLLYLRTKHPEIADVHAILGHCYMEQGRIDDAQICFKQAIELDPKHGEALSNLAYIYASKSENLQAALEMAQKALSLDNMRAEFHHTKGWVLFKTGEVKKSIAAFTNALQIKANYQLARYNLGLAYYITQNFSAALESFEQVLALNPSHHKAWLFKAICLARQKKAEESLAALEALRERLPEKATLRRVVEDLHSRIKLANERHAELPVPAIKSPAPIEELMAEAADFRRKGLVTRAKEKYLECQRLAPERFEPHFELGNMYAMAGLNKPAIVAWKKAQELNPEHYELELNMGKILHKLGQKDKAKENFANAMSLKEQDPEPRYYMGLLAYEEKHFESAESHALGALRLKQDFYKAMALLGMARIKLNRLKPARDIYESLYAKAPSGTSIKRHARKKLWELTKMMAPAQYPSVEDAMEVKNQMVRKISKADSDQQFNPSTADQEAFEQYGKNTMTVDDKLWVLRQLEKFSSVSTPTPTVPLRRDSPTQAFSSKEKQWMVKKLQSIGSRGKYALPPNVKVDKYSIKATGKEVKRQPDKADKFTLAGIEYAEKGFVNKALFEFNQAREMSPENLETLINLGYINTILGNFKDAFEAFAQATQYHPKNPLPNLALGNLYWLGGQPEKAIEQWKKANGVIKLDSKYNLIARSEKIWKRMLDINPVDIDAHSNLGLVYLFSGRLKKALAEFTAVVNLDNKKIEHDFYAAQAYTILYLHDNNKAMKKEAQTILAKLKKGPEPFPHADKLFSYLGNM
jgi:tetratricopeptide (TPR) repeat protein